MNCESMTCLFADSDRANGYLDPWCTVHKRDALACLRDQHLKGDISASRAKIGELREPTQAEGDAHVDRYGVSHVEFGEWYGRMCKRCDRWVFEKEAPLEPVCRSCTLLDALCFRDQCGANLVISAGRLPPFVQVGMVVFDGSVRDDLYLVAGIMLDPIAQSTLDTIVCLRDLENRLQRVSYAYFFSTFVLASPFVVNLRYTGQWRTDHVGVAEIDLDNANHHPGGETRV